MATDQTVSPDERNTALRNIGRTTNPELINRTLNVALNEVKEQDIYLPFQGYHLSSSIGFSNPFALQSPLFLVLNIADIRLRTHPEGIRALWSFAKDNWDTLVKKLPPGLTMLGTVVQLVTNSFTSKEAVNEIEQFYKNKSTKGFDQGLAQSLDNVRAKANWIERDAQDVRSWLSERGFLKGKL